MKCPSFPIRAVTVFLVLFSWSAAPALAAAPVARDDFVVATDRYLETVEGVETYSILIDVLANDEDADGDRLEVVVTGGGFGLPPAIWTPSPVGTVNYLGAGVFDLSFGKEELGDATEVTFQYELEGAASLATVRVTVAGEGRAPEVVARDDTYDDPWACWILLPVLANDTGVDVVQSFTKPTSGEVQRHPADPNVLVYRGGSGASFTYTAMSSLTGASATATVSVKEGNVVRFKSTSDDLGEIALADCFDRDDGVLLDGERVAYNAGGGAPLDLTWTARHLAHLDNTVTLDSPLPEGSNTGRRAYSPLFTGGLSGSAYQIQGTFRADSTRAKWVALAFTNGNGSVFSEADLWVRLNVETGALFLNGRWGGGLQEKLGTASPDADGYPFVKNGVNHLRLRYDFAPAVPKVDMWMNGVRVFSRKDHADITGSIENVGYFLYFGDLASSPGDVWFDDFEFRVGDVQEAVLFPKSGDPDLGVDVENGSTLTMPPLHVGCTQAHLNCHPFQETSLFLRNDGNETLEVSNVYFEGSTDWTLITPTTTSFSILPGEHEEIRVRVEALETGQTASRLELSTNDPDLPKLTVGFAAEITQAPVADFVHYCDGLSCSFDGGSSTGVGLNDFSYLWYLDGAFQKFGPTLSLTFSTSGVHTVELRVTDATAAEHRRQRTVGVAPEAAFTFTCVNATRTCDFDAAATSDGVVSYRYDFGDGAVQGGLGDPGAVIVRHTYATSGRYDVTLVVQDGDGQEDSVAHEVTLTPIPDFAASCSPDTQVCDFDASGSTPQMVLYEWRFGDGALGTGLQAAHTYATSGVYSVVLTVVDPAGQVEAVTKPVALPPRASFSVTCDPEARSCTFDGSSSTPGVNHSWSFGDGSPVATGTVQEHTYATSGVFTVTLTVTDSSSQTDSASRDVVIPPRADFSVACDSIRCEFDASASSPGVTAYSWDFGHDGQTGTGVDPTHEFPDEGDYDVSLTVTDGSGQTATTTKTVTVFNEELFLLILLDRR